MAALTEAVARNVWRGEAPEDAAGALAALVLDQAAHLRTQPLSALAAGKVDFRPARMAA